MKDSSPAMSVLVQEDSNTVTETLTVTLLMKQIILIVFCRGHVSEMQQTWDMEVVLNKNQFK